MKSMNPEMSSNIGVIVTQHPATEGTEGTEKAVQLRDSETTRLRG
jgi:hypothetical protein